MAGQNLSVMEKMIVRDWYEDLLNPELSDDPCHAAEVIQAILIHLIKEHGLFKEDSAISKSKRINRNSSSVRKAKAISFYSV